MNYIIVIFYTIIISSSVFAKNLNSHDKPYEQLALSIYKKLVSFRTVAGHGQVRPMADYMAQTLISEGFPEKNVDVIPFTKSDGEKTALFIAKYPGVEKRNSKGILLLGHMDVVDAVADDWITSPFTLVERDGYFFGRGASDNKLGIVSLITTFIRYKSEGYTPQRNLIIAFTGDEETGTETAHALATEYKHLVNPSVVLNSDAGGGVLDESGKAISYKLQAAEKTYATFELTANNPGGHSSMPRKDNAIYDLAKGLKEISEHLFPTRINEVTREFFKKKASASEGELAQMLHRFSRNPKDLEAADFLYNIPSLVGLTRTTCVATMLEAGHAENALPRTATATVNCRIFPGDTVDSIQKELENIITPESIDIKLISRIRKGPPSPLDKDLLEPVRNTVHRFYPNIPIIPYMSAYYTDGREFRAEGIPTYGLSGLFMKESDLSAHGLNERIPVRGFYESLDFWYFLLKEITTVRFQ